MSKPDPQEACSGFGEDYWALNYARPEHMDGIGNAAEHARYLKAYFEVEHVTVESYVEIGFGFGVQLREMLHLFAPSSALALDPSPFAQERISELQLDPYDRISIEIRRQSLQDWCSRPDGDELWDLGVCMSVFQYIPDDELLACIPVLGSRLQFLYLTVPTDIELQRQAQEAGFVDEYAIHRSQDWYWEALSNDFTFISSRVLESRHYFDETDTQLTDLLFRF